MNVARNTPGVLIISHGSPRAEANEGFTALVARVAARLGLRDCLPAFFSIAKPDIPDQVGALAARGFRRIVLMPYFLYTGQHVTKDIPVVLAECRRRFPEVTLEFLATLENDPCLEDVVVDRLAPLVNPQPELPSDGKAIERRSYEIIEGQLAGLDGISPAAGKILRRIIHATADVSFARSMRLHPGAVDRGRRALAEGKPILCDVRMLQAGITKVAGPTLCGIDHDDVIAAAREKGCTRAAVAMEKFASQMDGAIVAIGNAPTALWKVMEIARGGPQPALVVGLPVGFVGAREAKLALIESGLCYISNTSPRGGSPVAAAAVNALAMLDEEE